MWAATAAASASSPAVPPPPRRDYASLFARGKNGGCPPLFLAPMEGLGDARLRRSLSLSVGGFDEACREFTRVPGTLSQGAKAEKLLRGIALNGYDAEELSRPANASVFDAVGVSPGDVAESNRFREDNDDDAGPPLLAAQLMGSNPDLLEHCARVLARETRAPRVDLNCGCPANVVTGKGAGSSLLRDPNDVYACVSAIRRGCEGTGCVPTLKLRSGYDDDSLLRENLLAAQEGGAAFVTLHPRTRRQGYSGRANWKDIAIAVETLDVPVIGNGDVTSPERARALLFETGCAGIMVGRGAVQDPLVFRRIKAELRAGDWSEGGGGAASSSSSFGLTPAEEASEVVRFLRAFAAEVFADDLLISPRKRRRKLKGGAAAEEQFKLGKLKQIVKYLFAGNASLSPHLSRVLSCDSIDNGITAREMLDVVCDLVATSWDTPTDVLVDAFSMRTSYEGGRLLV